MKAADAVEIINTTYGKKSHLQRFGIAVSASVSGNRRVRVTVTRQQTITIPRRLYRPRAARPEPLADILDMLIETVLRAHPATAKR